MVKYDTSSISDDMVEATRKLKEQFGDISSSVNSIVGGISYGQVQTHCSRISTNGSDAVSAYNQLVYRGNNILSDIESLETRYRGEMEGYEGALSEGLYASQNIFEKAVNELYYKLFKQVLPMNYGYYDTVRKNMEAAEVSSHALYLIEEGMIPIWLKRSLEEKMAEGKLDAATLDIILDDYHDYETLPVWAQAQIDLCKTNWMDADSDEDKRFAHERAQAIRAQAAIYDTLSVKAQMEIAALYKLYDNIANPQVRMQLKSYIDSLMIKADTASSLPPVDVNLEQGGIWIDVEHVSQISSSITRVKNSGCAIACMAMVFNMMTGSSYDADYIYSNQDTEENIYAQWGLALDDLGLDDQIKSDSGSVLAEEVDVFKKAKETLDDGRPLVIRFDYYDTIKGKKSQHYVVVNGYTGDCNSPADLYISDPGRSEAVFDSLNDDGTPYTLQDAYDYNASRGREEMKLTRYVEFDYVD